MPLDNPFEPMIKNIGNYVSGALYGPGVIPPIGIVNYDGTELASPADMHLLAAKDAVINEIGVGMSGNLIGENTVTGAPPLQLLNSAGYPLQWFEVALSPYQEGTGDPAPDNVRPIHGTDKLTITTAGKNLYSKEDSVYNVPVYAQDGTSASYPDVAVWWMPAKPNTNYTISCNHNEKSFYVRWINCDSRKGFINRVGYAYTENDLPLTITTPANCEWVQIAINQYDTSQIALNDWEVMVVEGSTAADYEPYNGSQTVVTLPQTVYTGTIGSEGGESRWGEVDLGTLDWQYAATNVFIATAGIQNIKTSTSSLDVTDWIICECYMPSSPSRVYNLVDNNAITVQQNTGKLMVSDTTYTDAAAFKAAMSGVYLVYELATPTTFSVPAVTIPTPRGTATTWATAEDGTVDSMSAVYIQSE